MEILKKVLMSAVLVLVSLPVLADGHTGGTDFDHLGLMALAAGLGIGIAAFGAASGQGKAAAAALDGIARNPSAQGKMLVPLILSLALMESLVILAFIVNNSIAGIIKDAISQ